MTPSAPLAAERAFSDGQPSRGATNRRSVRPQLNMARVAVPIFSPSCGATRMMAGPPVAGGGREGGPALGSGWVWRGGAPPPPPPPPPPQGGGELWGRPAPETPAP